MAFQLKERIQVIILITVTSETIKFWNVSNLCETEIRGYKPFGLQILTENLETKLELLLYFLIQWDAVWGIELILINLF